MALNTVEHQLDEEPFWRTDLVFTADGGNGAVFAAKGINHVWLPPAVFHHEALIHGSMQRKWRCDLAFMGSHPYPHPEWRPYRDEMIQSLRRRFGGRFRVWPRGQAIRGQDLNDFYASVKVMVGDSCLVPNADGPCTRYWSDRVPETIGRGGFLIHPWVEGFEDEGFVDGETIVTYPLGDFAALRERVDYYLRHDDERRDIVTAGRQLVLERHTYLRRMVEVGAAVDALSTPPKAEAAVAKPAAKKAAKKPAAKKAATKQVAS